MTKEIERDGFITRDEDLHRGVKPERKSMVLVKDMEMPRSCSLCSLKDMYYGECNVKHRRIKYFIESSGRPDWCPLMEVEQYGPEGTLYKVGGHG